MICVTVPVKTGCSVPSEPWNAQRPPQAAVPILAPQSQCLQHGRAILSEVKASRFRCRYTLPLYSCWYRCSRPGCRSLVAPPLPLVLGSAVHCCTKRFCQQTSHSNSCPPSACSETIDSGSTRRFAEPALHAAYGRLTVECRERLRRLRSRNLATIANEVLLRVGLLRVAAAIDKLLVITVRDFEAIEMEQRHLVRAHEANEIDHVDPLFP